MDTRLYALKSRERAPALITELLAQGKEGVARLRSALDVLDDELVMAIAPVLGEFRSRAALELIGNMFDQYNRLHRDERMETSHHDNCEALIKAAMKIAVAGSSATKDLNNAERAQGWLKHVSRTACWEDLRQLAKMGRASAIGPRAPDGAPASAEP